MNGNLVGENTAFSYISFNIVKTIPAKSLFQYTPPSNKNQYIAATAETACFIQENNLTPVPSLCLYKTNTNAGNTYIQYVEVETLVSIPPQNNI